MNRRAPLPALMLAVLVAACGSSNGASGGPSGPAVPSASAGASASAGPAVPSPGEGEFSNPVIERYFADPFVLQVDGAYYAWATGNLTYNILVSTSEDLVEWTAPREALRNLPIWQPTSKGLTWAPEVIETPAGFVMHYTGRDVQAGRQCLAVAVAEEPQGPYVDHSDEPLLCQHDLGGSIDSTPFTDADGTRWLLWKNDGNCCGMPTRLFAQQLSEDGLTLEGEVHDLGLRNDQAWERDVIEAPTVLLRDGVYYLFYTGNSYNTRNYAIGYATAETLLGPYTKAAENPILATEAPVGATPGEAAGPGHQSIIEDDDGDLWMAYHAWDVARVGNELGGTRSMWIDELVIEGGKAAVEGPDAGPQPVP
jgi:beta-xylosidase